MNGINILWLYDDLLDLYGDRGNLVFLNHWLQQFGFETKVTRLSLHDELDLNLYQLVYIGPGKAKSLAQAAGHFVKYGAAVRSAVEGGLPFLVTGNSRLLFGREFTGFDGGTHPGIGLFPYVGRETGNVFISDVIACPVFEPQTRGYGFINRTAHIDGNNENFLFDVLHGAGDNEQENGHEGNLLHNFFGTWQLGPVLVKNPHLLRELLRRLAGDAFREPDCTLAQQALELTLQEFD